MSERFSVAPFVIVAITASALAIYHHWGYLIARTSADGSHSILAVVAIAHEESIGAVGALGY